MVKKISGNRPPQGTNVSGVKATTGASALDSIKATKTRGVDNIKATEQSPGSERIRKSTRPLTAAERDFLFQLIEEEADKLFDQKKLPHAKKSTITSAVKMAIDAGIVDEADEGDLSDFRRTVEEK